MNTEAALEGGGKVAVTITKAAEVAAEEKEHKEEQATASIVTGEPVVPIKWHQLFRWASVSGSGALGGLGAHVQCVRRAVLNESWVLVKARLIFDACVEFDHAMAMTGQACMLSHSAVLACVAVGVKVPL